MRLSNFFVKNWGFNRILQIKKGILIFLVLIFFLLDVYPKLWRMGTLSAQIKIARKAVPLLTQEELERAVRRLKEDLAQIAGQVQSLEHGVKDIQGKMAGDKNIADITVEVEDLAAAAKIELNSIKPLEDLKTEHETILPLEIGLRGEYARLIEFLTKIEGSATVMSLQNVTLRKNKLIDPQLEADLTLHILFPSTMDISVSEEKVLSH